jgi:riboflavin-specific deaminase-like protein
MKMQMPDVTDKVWSHLLAMRQGRACICCGGRWSLGEKAALDLYGPLARRDLGPVVVAQIGQSLDGRVATVTGDAADVSGPDGLAHLHRIRALVDAVVIGVGTAVHDNPQMTVRLCPGPHPARVVIDPNGRLQKDARLLADDGIRVILLQGPDVTRSHPAHIEAVTLPVTGRSFAPEAIVAALQDRGLQNLLVEGGGITIANFLDAGQLCRLQVAIAPLVIGNGPMALTRGVAQQNLADCLRPDTRVFALGSDVVFDCGLTAAAALATAPQHKVALRA